MPPTITTSRQIEARSRLDAELRAIALDLLGLFQGDELPGECAAWVRTTIEAAVSEVSEPAVSVLALRLTSALGDAPRYVSSRIDAARLRHEAGYAWVSAWSARMSPLRATMAAACWSTVCGRADEPNWRWSSTPGNATWVPARSCASGLATIRFAGTSSRRATTASSRNRPSPRRLTSSRPRPAGARSHWSTALAIASTIRRR